MIQWGSVEEAIRALTPDEYETLILRVSKSVFDAVRQAGEDLTDDQVRKRAAELALTLIGLIANRKLTVKNLDTLMQMYQKEGIVIGMVGTKTGDVDRGMRLMSDWIGNMIRAEDKAA